MCFEIREATAKDAEQVLAHLKRVLSEGAVDIPKLPSEMSLSIEDERQFLNSLHSQPNALFAVAETPEGQIVGNIDLIGFQRTALQHVVRLGISIQAPYRGQGLGRRLMGFALNWAQHNPVVKRIELFVYQRNTAAISLYRAYGFEIEGQRRGAVYQNGEYLDDLLMALWVG